MNKMLKAIAISTLTAAIAISSFGCSTLKNDNNDSKDSETSSISEKKFEDIKVEVSDSKDAPLNETNINDLDISKTEDIDKLKEIASSDDILIDMETEAMGIEAKIIYAKKGNNIFSNINMFGMQICTLVKDGEVYCLSDENKIYYKGSEDDFSDADFDTEDFKKYV